MMWRRIVAFRLVTSDLDRALRFYAALGFSPGARAPIPQPEMDLLGLPGGGLRQNLALGPSRLAVDRFAELGRTYPAGADAADLLFQHFALATDDAAAGWTRALAAGAAPISRDGPVALPASDGGVIAVKFRDPDGHPLEIIEFPGRARGRAQGLSSRSTIAPFRSATLTRAAASIWATDWWKGKPHSIMARPRNGSTGSTASRWKSPR